MDKEILAVIGRLYLDITQLSAFAENLKARVSELESQLANQLVAKDDPKKIK